MPTGLSIGIGIPFGWGLGNLTLPTCVDGLAIAWFKDLNSRDKTVTVGGDVLIPGLLAFDGTDDYVSFASIPDITGDRTISFYLYLLKSSGYSFNVITNITPTEGANDRLTVWLNGSNIEVNLNAVQSSAYSIAGLENTILFIEIVKYQDSGFSGQMTDFRINGVSQIESVSGTTWGDQGATIGANSVPNAYLEDALIWDFSTGGFTAEGQPSGNTGSAWSQSLSATVHGSPSTTSISGDIPEVTYYAIDDAIGERTDTVFFGQYLDSGEINFYRDNNTFDYINPATGSLVEGVNIPTGGLYTVPANGICDVGVYPRIGDINGLVNFDGIDDYISFPDIDVSGDKVLTFKTIVRGIGGVSNYISLGSTTDGFHVSINDGGGYATLYVGTAAGNSEAYGIDTYKDNPYMEISVTKTTGSVTSVTIDGDPALYLSDVTQSGIIEEYSIGKRDTSYGESHLIFDVNVSDEHGWAGNPDGNLDSAWLDTETTILPVPNSGAEGTTDWVDSNSNGTADGWRRLNGLASIVEEAGFTGKAQKLEAVSGIFGRMVSDDISLSAGSDYTLSLKVLHTAANAAIYVYDADTDIELGNIPLSSGSADIVTEFQLELLSTPASIYIYIYLGPGDGTWIAVDEVELIVGSPANGTVFGSPDTINISTTGDWVYTSFYPCIEGIGTVIHDVMEESIHISINTPVWDETLYGSDYLNQKGYVDKEDFTDAGYDFETIVDGVTETLNNDCRVPLALWEYVDLIDSEGNNLLTSEGDQIQVKQNI